MWFIYISCSLKPINTSDRIKSEWFNPLASVWTLRLLIIPSDSHDGSVTYLSTREKVTMTSALHGWQVVLARFEQRRQRVENHEARVSSLRLVVANHEFECGFQQCAKTKDEKFFFINALWNVKKRAPVCVHSKQFVLLTKRWRLSLLRNTNTTN